MSYFFTFLLEQVFGKKKCPPILKYMTFFGIKCFTESLFQILVVYLNLIMPFPSKTLFIRKYVQKIKIYIFFFFA